MGARSHAHGERWPQGRRKDRAQGAAGIEGILARCVRDAYIPGGSD